MGVSTDAILCFGFELPDEYEMPFEDEEEWWLELNNFKNSFEIFDSEGNFPNGIRPDEALIKEHFAERHNFLKENPLPFDVIRHCSGDYPMYIISTPDTLITAYRGYPVDIAQRMNKTYSQEYINKFVTMCKKYFPTDIDGYDYNIDYTPKWLMCSYWG